MVKQSFRFMLSAVLLVASGSLARADNFSIVSSWHTGSAQFGNLDTFTGDGSFTWNGSAFSNIVFSFVGSLPGDPATKNWTATTGDGELLNSNTELILGNGTTDCSGPSCVAITFNSALTTGSPLTLQGVSGFSQDPNTTFDSATLTDTSRSGLGAVPEPNSVILLLTVLMTVGLVVGKKLRRVTQAIES
jgi:hypothetical protein